MIYKHNEMIENFIFNATESELQIMNYAVAITNPMWENKNIIYTLSIPELVKTYKTKSNNIYKCYRDALDRLMKRTYKYYNSRGVKITENLITRIEEDPNDTSIIVFKFNEYVSSRISGLQGLFTKYNIKYISRFKSKYSFMLYEFFKMKIEQSKYNEAKSYKYKITVEDFKENLLLEKKYKVFALLEKNVLKIAQSNINSYSDINLGYKIIRKARTPTHIVFTAKYKETTQEKKVVQKKITAPPKNIEVVVPENNIDNSKSISESQRSKGKDHCAKLKDILKNKTTA